MDLTKVLDQARLVKEKIIGFANRMNVVREEVSCPRSLDGQKFEIWLAHTKERLVELQIMYDEIAALKENQDDI